MISFVLFPQASQPSMNFNISELVSQGETKRRMIFQTNTVRFRPKWVPL